MIKLIGFDADDTLWHNEPHYQDKERKFADLLVPYADKERVSMHLFEKEKKNIEFYGYGIKSFTLSMIETAIELSAGRITAEEILRIIGFAHEVLSAEVELLAFAEETVAQLSNSYDLVLITKGDLRDQERKLSHSGLKSCFRYIEIVSEKDVDTYKSIFEKYKIEPSHFVMVGNSLKSDILPVLALGAHAVYIPYHVTWEHERVPDEQIKDQNYHEIKHMGELGALISEFADRLG